MYRDGSTNMYIPKISRCVLKNMNVDYSLRRCIYDI